MKGEVKVVSDIQVSGRRFKKFHEGISRKVKRS